MLYIVKYYSIGDVPKFTASAKNL